MSATPLYDTMCKAVHDLWRNLDRDARRIADPAERLRYYQTIAASMRDAETKLVQIRRRGERHCNRLMREGVIPRCDQEGEPEKNTAAVESAAEEEETTAVRASEDTPDRALGQRGGG